MSWVGYPSGSVWGFMTRVEGKVDCPRGLRGDAGGGGSWEYPTEVNRGRPSILCEPGAAEGLKAGETSDPKVQIILA